MTLSSFTLVMFAAFSSIRIVSYVPQIKKVASDTNGASAISYSTWGLWTAANVATAAYALVNLGDTYLATVSAVYAVCCLTVIGLTAAKRRNLFRRDQDERRQAAEAEQASLAERSVLMISLRSRAHAEAAALLSGGSRDPQFEREVASHARRIAYHDFMRLLRPRLKSLGNGATDASPKTWRLRPR